MSNNIIFVLSVGSYVSSGLEPGTFPNASDSRELVGKNADFFNV
jgi:hypothetical protein